MSYQRPAQWFAVLNTMHVQVQQARLESEESSLKLEMTQRDAQEAKVRLEREKEQVRKELLARLRELETLPDRLRRTEQQLRDAQQEAEVHERKNTEHNCALSEVRHKVIPSSYTYIYIS